MRSLIGRKRGSGNERDIPLVKSHRRDYRLEISMSRRKRSVVVSPTFTLEKLVHSPAIDLSFSRSLCDDHRLINVKGEAANLSLVICVVILIKQASDFCRYLIFSRIIAQFAWIIKYSPRFSWLRRPTKQRWTMKNCCKKRFSVMTSQIWSTPHRMMIESFHS